MVVYTSLLHFFHRVVVLSFNWSYEIYSSSSGQCSRVFHLHHFVRFVENTQQKGPTMLIRTVSIFPASAGRSQTCLFFLGMLDVSKTAHTKSYWQVEIWRNMSRECPCSLQRFSVPHQNHERLCIDQQIHKLQISTSQPPLSFKEQDRWWKQNIQKAQPELTVSPSISNEMRTELQALHRGVVLACPLIEQHWTRFLFAFCKQDKNIQFKTRQQMLRTKTASHLPCQDFFLIPTHKRQVQGSSGWTWCVTPPCKSVLPLPPGTSPENYAHGATQAQIAARAETRTYLVGVDGALGDDVAALLRHQVEQLVDDEGRRHVLDAAARDVDRLAADRAAERRRVAVLRVHDAAQAAQTHRVRTWQQLRCVLLWKFIRKTRLNFSAVGVFCVFRFVLAGGRLLCLRKVNFWIFLRFVWASQMKWSRDFGVPFWTVHSRRERKTSMISAKQLVVGIICCANFRFCRDQNDLQTWHVYHYNWPNPIITRMVICKEEACASTKNPFGIMRSSLLNTAMSTHDVLTSD